MATSFEDGLAYEAARELINSRIGTLSSELSEENSKAAPDVEILASLRSQRRALVVEREELRSDDRGTVLLTIQKYRRPPEGQPIPSVTAGH
ncbi:MULTISPECIES: hypothetical protein [Xanthomonas]|uniref:hypothetical protein n=1 Tax=Xanthomonas TaxID=338 RepID=UPI00103FA882|nr:MULTISPECIES: hypothetical protein [Xanthomonas]